MPIWVPTIILVTGAIAANKMMNGKARKKDTILSKIQNQVLLGAIPFGAVIIRPIPKIKPKRPPKIADQNVMYSVCTIAVHQPVSPPQP